MGSVYDDRPIITANGDCRTSTWAASSTTWGDVCSWIETPADQKECGGYVLGHFEGHDTGSVRRSKDTFTSAWAVKLDAERSDGNLDLDLIDKLENLGFDAIAHTTASSTVEAPRWRFLILASRSMDREELRLVTKAIEDELGADNFDSSANQGERFMYLPARGTDGSYSAKVFYGEPLDVDQYIELGRELDEKSNVVGIRPGLTPEPTSPLTPLEVKEWTRNVTEFLDELRALRPGDSIRYHGKQVGWDTGAWFAAMDLVKISNSSNGELTLDAAQKMFFDHAPQTEPGFNPVWKWRRAAEDAKDEYVRRTDDPAAARKALGFDPYATLDADLAANVAYRGLAERFRFSTGFGWAEWDGKRWDTACDDQRVLKAFTSMIPDMLRDWAAEGVDAGSIGSLAKARNTTKARQVIAALEAELLVRADQFDQKPMLLNVSNGTIDLSTGHIRAHERGDLLTKITNVPYVPSSEHEDWQKTLEAFGDPDTTDWMQLRFGQAATGMPAPDGILAVLKGGGENGKSAILDAIVDTLGEYALHMSTRVLLGSNRDHTTDFTDLMGARLAVAEELPDGRHLNVEAIKRITDTDKITARKIRRDNVTFETSHTTFVTTNYDLAISETDEGTWRRFALVTFPFKFVKGEPRPGTNERKGDRNLKVRMKAGKSGRREAVLAWLVAGAVHLYRDLDGIIPEMPQKVADDTADWRSRSDVIHAFTAERLVPAPGVGIFTQEMYEEFCQWHEERGGKQMAMNTFSSRFEGHERVHRAGIRKTRTSRDVPISHADTPMLESIDGQKRIYEGVRFRTRADDAA